VPAITNPETFGLVRDPPNIEQRRMLVLIAKVIQNLSNNQEFGRKEQYMMKLNDFIRSNDKVINNLFDQLAMPASTKEDISYIECEVPQTVYESSLFKIYDHCMTNIDKIALVLEDNTGNRFTDAQYTKRLTVSRELSQILTEISKNTAGMSSGHARKTGYLKKAGISNKGSSKFQKRWVVLSGNSILYYKSEGDKKAQGSFQLADVAKVEVMTNDETDEKTSKTFILKLSKSTRTQKDKRAYMFLAKTPEECQSWITAITANKHLLDEASSDAAQQRKTKHYTIRGGVLTEATDETPAPQVSAAAAAAAAAGVAAPPALATLPAEDSDTEEPSAAAGEDDDPDEGQYQDQLNRMAQFLAADDDEEDED
jgi:hypothetical protein